MTLTSKQIINLPVITENDKKIGKVLWVEINEKTHVIEKYAIKTANFLSFIPAVLLISPRQIIEINSNHMLVEDNIIKNIKKLAIQKNPPIEDPSPAVFIDLTAKIK